MGFFRRNEPAAPTPTPTGTNPAISEDEVRQAAPALVSLYKSAGVSLTKRGLSGERAAVYLVLDRSGSMGSYYRDGSVQHLAEQALGLSANLDDDGVVPVVFFDHRPYDPIEVGLDDYAGRIDREHQRLGQMGGTAYGPAINKVLKHYKKSKASAPAFVIFQTDGEPSDRNETEYALRSASRLPIFWQFVGFGRRFSFLERLDELDGRSVDNAGFFAAGLAPLSMSDADLYDRLMAGYPAWLSAARAKGIVR